MNHFMGIGRVGMVDSRKIKNDVVVTSVSVALNERYPDKDGKPVEKTTWVRVTCWRKLGEIAQQILHTGDLVAFTGKLEQPSVYKNQKGEYVASAGTHRRDHREAQQEGRARGQRPGRHDHAHADHRQRPAQRDGGGGRQHPDGQRTLLVHQTTAADCQPPGSRRPPPGCGRNGTMTKYISVLTLRHVVLLIILIVVLLNSR